VDDLKAAERGVLLIRKAGKGSASRPLGRLICHPSSSDDSAAWLTHKESGRPLTRARTISIDLEGSIVYTEAKRAAEQSRARDCAARDGGENPHSFIHLQSVCSAEPLRAWEGEAGKRRPARFGCELRAASHWRNQPSRCWDRAP